MLEGIVVPRTRPGRPRIRPTRVRADRGYFSRANRAYLRRRGIGAAIPQPADQVSHRRRLGGRGGTPWNAASTASSATAPWPSGTTVVHYQAVLHVAWISDWLTRLRTRPHSDASRR
uniref:hypothetical protein n=1 Tax=Actinomadura sp. CA-154981 TaxID=3240037 RepID=UPI003F491756